MYRLCLMHPMDPCGSKLGGIETHVRHILRRHPRDFSVLMVGVDESGGRPLGRTAPLAIGGRQIDFLPVARIPQARINLAAKSILGSTTFRFALGSLRHLAAIRRQVAGRFASADIQRFEFALIPRLLGLPTVQMVHGEGSRNDRMDSLIKTYWAVHATNERIALRLADRILCVNPSILTRLEREFPAAAPKAEVMSVSVDADQFAPQPFDCADGILRIVFAGRLDEFKDPPLMFEVLAALHARLNGKLEFHYIGTSEPSRYHEFAAIEAFTTRHGYQPAAGVAAIVARSHAGILTSFFEGLPCYLLETLSVGRPFAAIALPQYDPFIVPGLSGTQIRRRADMAGSRGALVEAFLTLWGDIRAGRIDPMVVHQRVTPYTLDNQMDRLFDHHRRLQDAMMSAAPRRILPRLSVPLAAKRR
ncbi:MAG: glycosyltransferase family 4 protein [Methylobacteriaceae bacterium]|nr:glycosyltransferase family 4 protein [Methylobacteriaceae bacterium]